MPGNRKRRSRLLVVSRIMQLAAVLLLAGLLALPVPLRIGGFELTAYLRAETVPTDPRPGVTYLTATGFRGDRSGELIFRAGNGSLRIAWVIGG